jgi:hypothetical protein
MDPEKDPKLEGPRNTEPDDRGLLGPDDFERWNDIDTSIQKSEFWKSRCYDKEPSLMQYAESLHYGVIHQMGKRLQGLFHHQPWFAVIVHKALTDSFMMGLYFGERRFHHSPENMMPRIEYPDPTAGPSPMDEPPPDDDEVVTDFEDDDFA